jgi:aminomethyltransferase
VLQKTCLYNSHLELNARMVPFAGWEMPVQYAGVIPEVKAVREAVGMFDVSHMGRVYITGEDVLAYLQYLTTNDVSKLIDGGGQYSMMCRPSGGVIDDIIVYRIKQTQFLVVINAGNREKDIAWMQEQAAAFSVLVQDASEETALIAVQGPKALELLGIDPVTHPRFSLAEARFGEVAMTAARTGYTGEDGAELICSREDAPILWSQLLTAGVVPCGLGARDVLRLEAALPLYGHEMDETVNPYEARIGWAVKLDKSSDFLGKIALSAVKSAGPARKSVGIRLEGRGIPREEYPVCLPNGGKTIGHVTSGTFSPTVGHAIALARVESEHAEIGTVLDVEIRGQRQTATVVKPPFYKNI